MYTLTDLSVIFMLCKLNCLLKQSYHTLLAERKSIQMICDNSVLISHPRFVRSLPLCRTAVHYGHTASLFMLHVHFVKEIFI